MNEHLDGSAWSLTGTTGTMAASLGANSIVFAMGAIADDLTKVNPQRRGPLEIEGIQVVFTAIVASATPVAAGRALRLFKASNNAQTMPAGGTALTALEKRTLDRTQDSGLSGAQIATTGALTVAGFTRGTVPLATVDLSGAGAVGGRVVHELFEIRNGSPLWLDPGEILVLSNPAAFDALLTWQLTVNVDYRTRDYL
jgi:hypothetical protein